MLFAQLCPVAFTSKVLGGKWKPRIVWALTRHERLRFSEIRRACAPISDRILTKELRELEEWGIAIRRQHSVIPPHTDYRLSDLGHTLRPVMMAMADWGLEHRAKVAPAAQKPAI